MIKEYDITIEGFSVLHRLKKRTVGLTESKAEELKLAGKMKKEYQKTDYQLVTSPLQYEQHVRALIYYLE